MSIPTEAGTPSFQQSLAAQFDRVFVATKRLDSTSAKSVAAFNESAAKLDNTLADAMAGLMAIERDASIKRVRAQAANRARINGVCPIKAADDAQAYLESGLTHERAVSEAAGEYVRQAA